MKLSRIEVLKYEGQKVVYRNITRPPWTSSIEK